MGTFEHSETSIRNLQTQNCVRFLSFGHHRDDPERFAFEGPTMRFPFEALTAWDHVSVRDEFSEAKGLTLEEKLQHGMMLHRIQRDRGQFISRIEIRLPADPADTSVDRDSALPDEILHDLVALMRAWLTERMKMVMRHLTISVVESFRTPGIPSRRHRQENDGTFRTFDRARRRGGEPGT